MSSRLPTVCAECGAGPLSPEAWRWLIEGEELAYSTTQDVLDAGLKTRCELCRLLSTFVDRAAADIEIRLHMRPDPDGSFNLPKDAQYLYIRAVSEWDSEDFPLYMTYCVYTTPDDPAADEIVCRAPILQVDSPRARTLALGCLNDCIANHEICPKPGCTRLPTRVIDCDNPARPRLIPSEELEVESRSPYVALSYVWGRDSSHCTRRANIDSYLLGINLKLIPQTIHDAITVTNGLGLRYLRVDAFCIIQDSDEDKTKELVRMGEIYRDAYVTIIASSAAHGNAGFLQERELPPHYRLPFHCADGRVGSVYVGLSVDTVPTIISGKEPVDQRAWCMQERLLSPRKLLYTTDTLRYHCQTNARPVENSIREGSIHYLDNALLSLSSTASLGAHTAPWTPEERLKLEWNQWGLVVSSYTQRLLTQKTDKLLAFAGVAEQFERIWRLSGHEGRYLAGLWEPFLLSGDLLWHREPLAAEWYDNTLRPRPSEYLAPSWSWASVEGQIRVQPRSDWALGVCEVLECDVTLMDGRLPYGRVTGGFLKMRAVVLPAPRVLLPEHPEGRYNLLVPTEKLRKRMAVASCPSESVVVGEADDDFVASEVVAVNEGDLRSELFAMSIDVRRDEELLMSVGTMNIHFDGTERGAPDETWVLVVAKRVGGNGRDVETQGLLVTGRLKRIGYWVHHMDLEKDNVSASNNIGWLALDAEKRIVELI